ncbi:unnamed protein product, partial [Ectocarpus sp. 12 AP-2014]
MRVATAGLVVTLSCRYYCVTAFLGGPGVVSSHTKAQRGTRTHAQLHKARCFRLRMSSTDEPTPEEPSTSKKKK